MCSLMIVNYSTNENATIYGELIMNRFNDVATLFWWGGKPENIPQ